MIDVRYIKIQDEYEITSNGQTVTVDSEDVDRLIDQIIICKVDRYMFIRELHEGYH